MTECTKTKDEQSREPYRPFPNKEYLRLVLNYLRYEPNPVKGIKKSRTMMLSWVVTAWATHQVLCNPAILAVVQSRDEDTALTCVGYAKELWKNSDPLLRQHWPLEKALEKQPDHEFTTAHGSSFMAIPGDPDKIRSKHPTIVILDEIAWMDRGEEAYNVAVATLCKHLILLSSAGPGFFEDLCASARPVVWPKFGPEAA
jgi:hypothetical protein